MVSSVPADGKMRIRYVSNRGTLGKNGTIAERFRYGGGTCGDQVDQTATRGRGTKIAVTAAGNASGRGIDRRLGHRRAARDVLALLH